MSCDLSLAMIWQMTYTHKLRKLCSATLNGFSSGFAPCKGVEDSHGFWIPIANGVADS